MNLIDAKQYAELGGSVLGPLLWIIIYNEVLTLNLPPGVVTIGLADNTGLTIVTRFLEEKVTRGQDVASMLQGGSARSYYMQPQCVWMHWKTK